MVCGNCLWFAIDPDGRLYLYRQYIKVQALVEDHAKAILHYSRDEPWPTAFICDHDAEDRATLDKHLTFPTIPAFKNRSRGIDAVATRLLVHGDGKPRLFVFRNSLTHRDDHMEENKQPIGVHEEIDAYVWKIRLGGVTTEQPVDEHNHAMDALRYGIAHLDVIEEYPTGSPIIFDTTPFTPGRRDRRSQQFGRRDPYSETGTYGGMNPRGHGRRSW